MNFFLFFSLPLNPGGAPQRMQENHQNDSNTQNNTASGEHGGYCGFLESDKQLRMMPVQKNMLLKSPENPDTNGNAHQKQQKSQKTNHCRNF